METDFSGGLFVICIVVLYHVVQVPMHYCPIRLREDPCINWFKTVEFQSQDNSSLYRYAIDLCPTSNSRIWYMEESMFRKKQGEKR